MSARCEHGDCRLADCELLEWVLEGVNPSVLPRKYRLISAPRVICREDHADGAADQADAAEADVVRELRRRSRASTSAVREEERANIVLARLDGLSVTAAAEKLGSTTTRPDDLADVAAAVEG